MHEFVEVALRTLRSYFLVDQRQAALVELLKELVPGNFFQVGIVRMGSIRELDTDDARLAVVFRACHF